MKYLFSLLLLLSSCLVQASQCEVQIEKQVKANGGWLMFYLDDGRNVEIDENDQLFVDGTAVELSAAQMESIKRYRSRINQHLATIKSYAQENAEFLSHLIDEIAVSLGTPDMFDGLKKQLDEFWHQVSDSYFNQGDFVLPAGSVTAFSEKWQQNVTQTKDLFDSEFLEQLWSALSAKMKQDDGINLTTMGEMLLELEARVSERLSEHRTQMDTQESNMCESLHGIVENENELREQIPELHDYRVFTI